MAILPQIHRNTARLQELQSALLADLETIGVEVAETNPTLAQLLTYVGNLGMSLDTSRDETEAILRVQTEVDEIIG